MAERPGKREWRARKVRRGTAGASMMGLEKCGFDVVRERGFRSHKILWGLRLRSNCLGGNQERIPMVEKRTGDGTGLIAINMGRCCNCQLGHFPSAKNCFGNSPRTHRTRDFRLNKSAIPPETIVEKSIASVYHRTCRKAASNDRPLTREATYNVGSLSLKVLET